MNQGTKDRNSMQGLAAHAANMLLIITDNMEPVSQRLAEYLQDDPEQIREYYETSEGFTPLPIKIGDRLYIINRDHNKQSSNKLIQFL